MVQHLFIISPSEVAFLVSARQLVIVVIIIIIIIIIIINNIP